MINFQLYAEAPYYVLFAPYKLRGIRGGLRGYRISRVKPRCSISEKSKPSATRSLALVAVWEVFVFFFKCCFISVEMDDEDASLV